MTIRRRRVPGSFRWAIRPTPGQQRFPGRTAFRSAASWWISDCSAVAGRCLIPRSSNRSGSMSAGRASPAGRIGSLLPSPARRYHGGDASRWDLPAGSVLRFFVCMNLRFRGAGPGLDRGPGRGRFRAARGGHEATVGSGRERRAGPRGGARGGRPREAGAGPGIARRLRLGRREDPRADRRVDWDAEDRPQPQGWAGGLRGVEGPGGRGRPQGPGSVRFARDRGGRGRVDCRTGSRTAPEAGRRRGQMSRKPLEPREGPALDPAGALQDAPDL